MVDKPIRPGAWLNRSELARKPPRHLGRHRRQFRDLLIDAGSNVADFEIQVAFYKWKALRRKMKRYPNAVAVNLPSGAVQPWLDSHVGRHCYVYMSMLQQDRLVRIVFFRSLQDATQFALAFE